jgi:hypothetical protein
MKQLKGVSLICIDCVKPGAAISSLRKSMSQCIFDEVLFFTNIDFKLGGITTIVIPEIKSKDEYSHFLLKHAWEYISTEFVLVTQHDSWVLNGELFDERLREVDYAGGLWLENDGLANGNGGFSWRSKRLMQCVGEDDFINATNPEDVALCRVYRRYLEKTYNLVWADDELCESFSFELRAPKSKTFGFHSWFHEPYREMVIIQRDASLGDTIMCEPIMEYFHKKGCRVVFETLPQFETLFHNHYFPVLFPRQIDPRVLETAKRYNLNMSYESDPKKLHLKAYYEFCGIPESEQVILNPRLNYVADESIRLFKDKYVVIHIDERAQPGRNAYGINWNLIYTELKANGYLPIQIGKGESKDVGIKVNTVAEPMMAYLLAGCEFVIAVDSGPANLAVALGKKLIVFHGSVDPSYIWPDMKNIKVITNHNKETPICDNVYCWHSVIGCEGVECHISKEAPPCTQFKTEDVLNAIKGLI